MAPNNSKPSKKASAPSAAGIKKNDAPTASSVLAKLKNTAKSNLQSFEAADQHGVVKASEISKKLGAAITHAVIMQGQLKTALKKVTAEIKVGKDNTISHEHSCAEIRERIAAYQRKFTQVCKNEIRNLRV
jgi:hypothetical protein